MTALLLLAALAAGAGSPATATATAPGPRSTATANLTYAVEQVCMPYVAEAKDEVLRDHAGVSPAAPGPKSAFTQLKMPARRVGVAGEVDVGVGQVQGGRICIVEVNAVGPAAERKAVEQLLGADHHHFAAALNGDVTAQNNSVYRYCAAAPSTMSVTARFQPAASPAGAPVTLIFGASIVRDRGCDDANYHPLQIAPPR